MKDIDIAIQDYIDHVKKFSAPINVIDCIDFIHLECNLPFETLMNLENEISNKMREYNV